tara:strand:- start:134 stop:799 length:666 start_codon:yes stop_codon:yes gene_type:complete
MTKVGIIIFPGSNCDRDLAEGLVSTGFSVEFIWHKNIELPNNLDILAIPGGFSFGDYLRCGAIAAKSPITDAVLRFAKGGGYLIGICNGFQVLCETGLLPGALVGNVGLKFICRQESLLVENSNSIFTSKYYLGEKIQIPIAHHDGNYIADTETIAELEGNGRVVFKYLENPNGSINNIAGVLSRNRRVLGMMPHPERAVNKIHKSNDGRSLFLSLLESFR